MKRLFLLRHAKSAWDDPTLADHNRPLAARGRQAATRMGRFLRAEGTGIERILCSPARRAAETLAAVLAELASTPPVETQDALYLGGPNALLAAIQSLPNGIDRAMIVAHNPDLHELAVALIRAGAAEPRRALAEKFPTGALAILEFPGGAWSEVMPGTGTLLALVRPRDLS